MPTTVNITEIQFINGYKYKDDSGITWTCSISGMYRTRNSIVNVTETYKEQIEDYYTICGIANVKFVRRY